MSSKISHKIKQRTNANDVFITPTKLAKKAIDMLIDSNPIYTGGVWYDPFKNSGKFYNQFPRYEWSGEHEWSEILEGKDFFKFDKKVQVICSNPPYSMLDKVFKKCISLKPLAISLLIGECNLTARRIQWMNDAGYGLTKLHICNVKGWYGSSVIVQFEKHQLNMEGFYYNRRVWREMFNNMENYQKGKELDKFIDIMIANDDEKYEFITRSANITPKRIAKMEKAGYGLTHIWMHKYFNWYGMSHIIHFTKNKKGIMTYDAEIWK